MWVIRMSWSVTPPRAETTTTTGWGVASTMCFTLVMLSGVPTELPPNFNIFMNVSRKIFR